MGISIRHLLVDQNDEVYRLSNRFFERLLDKSTGAALPQFAGRRIRCAGVELQMDNYQPIGVVRVVYYYLDFDAEGRLDRDRMMQDAALQMKAAMGNIFPTRSATVIEASSRFVARRRDHEVLWTPSPKIERAIHDAALGFNKFRRL
jgi:hypothetical protein